MAHNSYYVEDLEDGEFQIKSRKEPHAGLEGRGGHIAVFYDKVLAETICDFLNSCRYYPYNDSLHGR